MTFSNEDKFLHSKVAVVTGGGTGIGRAVALGLARDGFQITAHYHRSEEAAKSLLDEIAGIGGACELLQFDVAPGALQVKGIQDVVLACLRKVSRDRIATGFPECGRDIRSVQLVPRKGLLVADGE